MTVKISLLPTFAEINSVLYDFINDIHKIEIYKARYYLESYILLANQYFSYQLLIFEAVFELSCSDV